jgi:hypothetical protein
VSWTRVCRPLNRGGLGIVDQETFEQALRLRWLFLHWKVPSKPCHNSELLIDEGDRTLCVAITRVQVHNGKNARFWTDS